MPHPATPDLDNRVVNVSYTITFSAFDKTSNLPYTQVVRLFGDDTSVAGDPISAAPDDAIPGGVLAVNTHADAAERAARREQPVHREHLLAARVPGPLLSRARNALQASSERHHLPRAISSPSELRLSRAERGKCRDRLIAAALARE